MKKVLEPDNNKLSFEQAMEQLDNVVQELENGNIELEDSLKLFERGVELIAFCQKKIALAEQRVSRLINNGENLFLEPLADEENKE